MRAEVVDKALNNVTFTFDINLHACCGVANLTSQGIPFGQRKHIGAKPDTLNDASYHQLNACYQAGIF
jgi:hypothetical protein